ncbi:hypothetical protein SNE40_004527 [Patella caerulea]|uniref:LIM zinc-binding domain-containing protein n=1 Tax=Patella caerulea TaxID=87958 RepID=A0AAN8K390_PATCE
MATVQQLDTASIDRGQKRLNSLFLPPGINLQKCKRCGETVYHNERMGPVHDAVFHKTCFKCCLCGTTLNLKNYYSNQIDANDSEIYCVKHVPRIGGAKIDSQSMSMQHMLNKSPGGLNRPTAEVRVHGTAPTMDTDAFGISRAMAASRLGGNMKMDKKNEHQSSVGADALYIRQQIDAQALQRRYQRKLDKHHFPPHIAKKRDQLLNAQKELESQLKKEEDALFEKMTKERNENSKEISEEINREWEQRLKELTEKFERETDKKKKKLKDSDRKLMTIQFENEKKSLENTMTMKRDKKKKTMTLRLREKGQRATSEMVKKQSTQMLKLLATKQEELKQEIVKELEKETELAQKDPVFYATLGKKNGLDIVGGLKDGDPIEALQDAIEVLQKPAVIEPPAPHPPSCRKKDLYDNISIFDDIDEQVIRVAETEQETHTELTQQLTENLITDLEKARAIYRWITVKDLNVMEFDESLVTDTPMGLLRGIKYGTETYHVLFMRLCSYAGLHCVEIKGHSKSVGYEPGMKITPETFQNTWNCVLIDGDWRLIQCNWGARHLVMNKDKERDKVKRRDQIRYQYDEHYFLTDPDEFIQEFWPHDPKWQLLDCPLTLEDFEALPFVRSVFFHYGMQFDQHKSAVLETGEKGGIKISLRIPEHYENDLVFFYQLRFADKERRNDLTYRGANLERFVFQAMVDNQVTFSIHVPTVAEYFFEVFANKIDETNRCIEDNNSNLAPFRLKCACKFKVTCSSLVGKMHALPNCAAGEWGPKKAFRHFGLMPILPTSPNGVEKPEHLEIIKAGMLTVEDKFVIRFQIPRPLQFVAKLRMNQVEDYVLEPFIHLTAEGQVLTVSASLPQPGQYGIDLYARPKGATEGSTLSHACKYLINCVKVSSPRDIPKISPNLSNRSKWGPTAHFEDLGLKLLTHKEAKMRITDTTKICIEIYVPEHVYLSYQFNREPDEDYREYCTMKREDGNVKLNVNFVKSGNYMLSLYGRRSGSDDKSLPNIYNYLIQYTHPSGDTNGSVPSKSSSIFKKSIFSKKSSGSFDKYSDKGSDKGSDKS